MRPTSSPRNCGATKIRSSGSRLAARLTWPIPETGTAGTLPHGPFEPRRGTDPTTVHHSILGTEHKIEEETTMVVSLRRAQRRQPRGSNFSGRISPCFTFAFPHLPDSWQMLRPCLLRQRPCRFQRRRQASWPVQHCCENSLFGISHFHSQPKTNDS